MKARQAAVKWALGELKAPVLMGARGRLRFNRETRSLMPTSWDFNVWDCSGLVTAAIDYAAEEAQNQQHAPMRGTHNAQLLCDGSRAMVEHEPVILGDLAFYGTDAKHIIHVAMFTAGGKVISADGATWGITTLEQAKASRCAVRLHENEHFRGDWVCNRRNVFLDRIDHVSR